MLKNFLFILGTLVAISAAYASCPIDSAMCVSDLLDIESTPTFHADTVLKDKTESYTHENHEYIPTDQEQTKREFNTLQNNTGTYDANCQFGVCLPYGKDNMTGN